ARYGAAVVGLTIDKSGLPETVEKRVELARTIMEAAESYGIDKDDLFIDCLTLTISAQQEQAVNTLEAVRIVTRELGLKTVLGVSNISFGLPERSHITVSFLTQALGAGLTFPIVNPNNKEIMDAVYACRAISGQDKQCEAYIERFAGQDKQEAPAGAAGRSAASDMTIEAAILKGLKKETAELTKELLENMSEMDVIDHKLIPALDAVGEKYEKQELFLPQLINAANAACAGFDVIKARLSAAGEDSIEKGTVLVATVEGDIHDIGKNIVKVVLENYGFRVVDLGRDVPPEKIVQEALSRNIKLVGLSALMTTTVVSMRKTVEALHAADYNGAVMVGGAVLTKEYADRMGADYYAKDAREAANIAKQVFGVG
ncbi:MAG: cobalamin-dependent protein, partial [Lachnospiraceae bacterium]|nr:cobalamin-dependent protein [Lachnospiraceae bacterium]